MEYRILSFLKKHKSFVDAAPFFLEQEFERNTLYSALSDMRRKQFIESSVSPDEFVPSWEYLRDLNYGEGDEMVDANYYGADVETLIRRDQPVF